MAPPRFHPFVRLILAAVGTLAMGVLVALVIGAALKTAARITGQAVDPLAFVKEHLLLVTLLGYPPVLAWIWFCRRAFDRRNFVSLGFRVPGSARGFGMGALCGALAISFLFGLLWVTGNVRINGPSPDAFEIGPVATLSVLVFFALAFFGVGLMEEVTFRGYALHNLAAWMGVRAAVAFQAVAFALVHLGNVSAPDGGANGGAAGAVARSASSPLLGVLWDTRWAMLNIALIGWFFALCYLKTGSLWFPIGFHTAWNFFLGCVWSMPVSGLRVFRIFDITYSPNALATGGGFGAEGSVFLPAIIITMIVLLRQMPDAAQSHHDLALLQRDRSAPATPSSVIATDFVPLQNVLATNTASTATTSEITNAPVMNAPDVNALDVHETVTEQSTPSRFKTSMRPAPRFGQAAVDAAQWPHMSTHAAAPEDSAPAPDEIAADSALRVDVWELQMAQQKSNLDQSNDSTMLKNLAAPVGDDADLTLGDDATSQQRVSAAAAAAPESEQDANDSKIRTATRDESQAQAVVATPMQVTLAPLPLANDAVAPSNPVAPLVAAQSPVSSDAAISAKNAEVPVENATGEVSAPSSSKGPSEEARPAVKKSSPRW